MSRNPYQMKSHNYVLRSRHTEALLRILVLASAGQVFRNGKGLGGRFVKANLDWAGNCGWEVKQLMLRGMLQERGGKLYCTSEGSQMMLGALTALKQNAADILAKVERIEVQ